MKTTMPRMMICLVAVLTMMVIPAKAAVQVNDTTEISLSVFIPCAAGGAGETVDLSGPLHTLVSSTVDGNNVGGYFHFQPQGISGIGESTGIKYHATGVTSESFKNSLQNGHANLTFVNNFRIIGQGPNDNYLVHETMHVTINADGTATVFHDNFSIECK